MKLKHGGIYRKGQLIAICVSSFYPLSDGKHPLRLMWLSGTNDQHVGPVLLNDDPASQLGYEYLGMIDWPHLEAQVAKAYENIETEKDNET